MLFYPTFVKSLIDKNKPTQNNSLREITTEINQLRLQISVVQSHFDVQTNFDLIDSNIHELDSLEKRYTYLIKEAKRRRQLELEDESLIINV